MPIRELFDRMPEEYRNEILPPGIEKRMAVEAGIPMGWEKYVGSKGCMVGISGFGASAPGNVVMEKYGFTVENIVAKALECLNG